MTAAMVKGYVSRGVIVIIGCMESLSFKFVNFMFVHFVLVLYFRTKLKANIKLKATIEEDKKKKQLC